MLSFLYTEILGLEIIDWIILLILLMIFYLYSLVLTISNQIARVHNDVNHERDKEIRRLHEVGLPSGDYTDTSEEELDKKTELSFIGKAFKYLFWFFFAFITVGAIVSSLGNYS
jgi:hypothetical protein